MMIMHVLQIRNLRIARSRELLLKALVELGLRLKLLNGDNMHYM